MDSSSLKQIVVRRVKKLIGKEGPDFTEVDQKYREGDWRQAINFAQEIVAKYPNSADAHYKLAMVLVRSGQLRRAEVEFNRAIDLGAGSSLTEKIERARQSILEKERLWRDEVSERLSASKVVLQEAPPSRFAFDITNVPLPNWYRAAALEGLILESTESRNKYIELMCEIGKVDRVYDIVERVGGLSSLSENTLVAIGRSLLPQEYRERLVDLLKVLNSKRPQQRRQDEYSFRYSHGDIGGAFNVAERLAQETDASNPSWNRARVSSLKLGNYGQAEWYAAGQLLESPTYAHHFALALAAELSGDYETAREQYRKCVARQKDAKSLAAQRLAVVLNRRFGDARGALKELEPFWREFDADQGLRISLGLPELERGMHDSVVPESVGIGSNAIRLAQNSLGRSQQSKYLEAVTEQALASSDREGAMRALWQMIFSMEHHDAKVFYRLGYLAAVSGRMELAASIFEISLAIPSAHAVSVKKVESRREQVWRYLEVREIMPIHPSTFLWEAHFGNRVDCNPYAMWREMSHRPEMGDAIHIIVANDACSIPDDVLADPRTVVTTRESEGYWHSLAMAEYLVNNASFSFEYMRRDGQVYANTWHGTPLKYLGRDDRDSVLDYGNVSRNLIHASDLFMPNLFTLKVMTRHYDCDKLLGADCTVTGYPRNDVLVHSADRGVSGLRRRLGLPDDGKPIVLYAPTWRGNSKEQRFDTDRLIEDLRKLGKSDRYHLIFRGHPLSLAVFAEHSLPGCIPDPAISTYDLLNLADIVITDYSSLGVDFLAVGRPIIYYVYDYEEYSTDRGLYFDLDEFPGRVVSTLNELLETLTEFLTQPDSLCFEMEGWRRQFAGMDDGHASARCNDLLIGKKDRRVVPPPATGKKRLLVHSALSDVDRSRACIQALNSVDFDRWEVTLTFDRLHLISDETLKDLLIDLDPEIRVLPRKGGVVAKFEESQAIDILYSMGRFPSKSLHKMFSLAMRREAQRLFASATFDVVIEWGDLTTVWTGLLGYGVDTTRRILICDRDLVAELDGPSGQLRRVLPLLDGFDEVLVPRAGLTDIAPTKEFREVLVSRRITSLDSNALTLSHSVGAPGVYVGQVDEALDLDFIVKAFGQANGGSADTSFVIRGSGPGIHIVRDRFGDANSDRLIFEQCADPRWVQPLLAGFYFDCRKYGPVSMGLLDSLAVGIPVAALMRPGLDTALLETAGVKIVASIDELRRWIDSLKVISSDSIRKGRPELLCMSLDDVLNANYCQVDV
ncbi:CDP-glycerol glycerophosphotransferase family protein [Actinomyces respiraculi]|uniref:CDP-glycerol glycerophosphotransferase family protein n=1 Tax=Actinomyces respiraculi TaxID=2744574 RepID=UPI00141F2F81|nr:CDP-glycerol glycerophosphotransferase family protein [Actinomyces respiraculi]